MRGEPEQLELALELPRRRLGFPDRPRNPEHERLALEMLIPTTSREDDE